MFQWHVYYIKITKLLQVTINFRKSHSQLSSLRNSCAKIVFCSSWVDLQVSVCWRQYPKRRARNFWRVSHFSFVNFTFPPTPQTKIWVSSGDSNSSISITAQNQPPVLMSFSSKLKIFTSQNIYLTSWITLYIPTLPLMSDNLLPLLVKLVRSYCCLPLVIGSYFIFDSRKPLATPLPLYWLTEHLLHCTCHSVCSRDSPESWQMQILRRYEPLILGITWQNASCWTRHDSRPNVWQLTYSHPLCIDKSI
jgi:hypothetical protein